MRIISLLFLCLAFSFALDLQVRKDLLNGYQVDLPSGWGAKMDSYGLVLSDGYSFVLIRGSSKRDKKELIETLVKEARLLSRGGQIRAAYKDTKNGTILYMEGLQYPYAFLEPNMQMYMYNVSVPQDYRTLHYLLSSNKVWLLVSVYMPSGVSDSMKEDLKKVLSTITFLPASQRLPWRYQQITDPYSGMLAVKIPVPQGFSIKGGVIDQGTKRWFVYRLDSQKGSISVDLIDINTQGVGGNAMTVLTIDGSSSRQPQPICFRSEEDPVYFALSIDKAVSGKNWNIKYIKNLPESALSKQIEESTKPPPMPSGRLVSIKKYFLAESDDGALWLGAIRLSGSEYFQGGIVSSYGCFYNMTLRSIKAKKENMDYMLAVNGGVESLTRVNPEWSLHTLKVFTERNRRINQMVREMLKDSQEFNSWMSKSWANVLSDQTYVRDPSTGEVFRLYKNSWETGEFWREPVFQDVILGGVREGSKLQELLQMEGWKKLEESIGGFK
ncbi:hypothetical protein HRbin13_00886 [bacterium HR13]|nr:hypothetical protein HRbin13_00886 [bacterium HR13]